MSEHPPTLLIVYLRSEHDENARYHIDEMLTTAGITYRLIAELEERVSLESAESLWFSLLKVGERGR